MFLMLQRIVEQTHIAGMIAELQKAPTAVSGITPLAFLMVEEQSPARRTLGKNTLLLLSSLKRLVTFECLAEALAVVEDNSNEQTLDSQQIKNRQPWLSVVVESCIGLVTVAPDNKIVTIVHSNIGRSTRSLWMEHFNEQDRVRVVLALLTYLLLPEFSTGPCNSSIELRDRLQQFSFYAYTARFWAAHIHEVESRPAIDSLARRFLESDRKLAAAVQISDLAESDVRRLCQLQTPENLDASIYERISPLQMACRFGLTRNVWSILSTGCKSINDGDINGVTPLHEAAKSGARDIVDYQIRCPFRGD